MKKIDYRHYSLEDLESALSAIDKEKFPENYSALIEVRDKRIGGEPPLEPSPGKGAAHELAGFSVLNWAVLVSAQVWALIGLLNGRLYIPSKSGGITFTGSSVYLAFASMTGLVVSGIHYMKKRKGIQKNQADRNVYWFTFTVSIALFAWACIVND